MSFIENTVYTIQKISTSPEEWVVLEKVNKVNSTDTSTDNASVFFTYKVIKYQGSLLECKAYLELLEQGKIEE